MSPQQTRSRQSKRLLAIAGATIAAVGGTIGLAFAADSDDPAKPAVQPVTTAPPAPVPTVGTHWPAPPAENDTGDTTREDGGPEEGTRGPSRGDSSDSGCVDGKTGDSGPDHC